ncbi:MAG: pyruvate kinase [Bacteroidia bacterium]|nr:pyruvate kinase [Bacteroidia bacterium]
MKEITFNRTKIVCTIGPVSESKEALRDLILAGMDVARLNFSHGTHEYHLQVIKTLRELNEELETNVAILADMQGPKIRVGLLEKPFPIKPGDIVFLNSSITVQDGNVLPMQYETFAEDVNPGELILVDDGKVELLVKETNKKDLVKLEVLHGDEISSKKGVNLPFTNISLPSITEKDIRDIRFAIAHDADWIALSFVRNPREVKDLKKMITEAGSGARVIAKIEKPEALKNIDEIIDASDGIMVARGDMGVEINLEDVPMWQKTIISKCNERAKPVIVATQMMESMITNRRPTRAEASDVANAVMDGADAVMLSGETSVGKYPTEVVRSIVKILTSIENGANIYFKNLKSRISSETFLNDTLIVSGCKLAMDMDAEAITGMTVSGYTAFQLSKCRPKAYIYIFTENRKLLNILSLVWGVRAFYYDQAVSTDDTLYDVTELLRKKKLVTRGDIVITTASMPLHARRRTNTLKFEVIE